jgi:hypothetical protein
MTKKRTATDWLKYAGVVIGVVAVLAGILYPEIRRALHLDKVVPPPASVVPPVAPQVTKTEKPPVEKPRRSAPQVAGGDHNSPAVGTISQGPGSITQIGGQGNQATIIGTIGPHRVLTTDESKNLTDAVRLHPAKILILYTMDDGEAYAVAQQIADALVAGGWTLTSPVSPAMMMREGGGPLYGMVVGFKGDSVPPGQRVRLDMSTSSGILATLLYRYFHEDFTVLSSPNQADDLVVLKVFKNPKPN